LFETLHIFFWFLAYTVTNVTGSNVTANKLFPAYLKA